MAEITKTPIISISTGEAVKNVKELKDNIKALKEQLDNAETSTADYSDIVKQLSQNQAALRNVMNGVSSSFNDNIQAAQGLGTSYNSLVQQLKQATQEWRAVPKYLSEADQAAGKVNQAWTTAAQKVYDLRTELKSMDADTNSFVRNVGNYKSALEGFSGTMNTVKQVGGDMVNGLQSAASTFALLGVNTDGLNDSMKNLRIILAAVQGATGFAGMITQLKNYFKAGKQATQATKEQTTALNAETASQTAANVATNAGTVAMNGFQKALIATGIGALVVGLGMLVAHFEDIVKWVGKVGERMGLWKIETDKANEANEKLKNSLETQNRAFENQAKIMRAQGATNKSILLQKKELIKSQINETKAAIAAAEARIKQLEADHRWWKFWQGTKGKVEKELENIKEWNDSLKDLTNSLEDINTDIRVEDITSARKTAEKAAQEAARKAAEALSKSQEIIKKGADEAKKAVQGQETALQKLDREYGEQKKLIEDAIAETKKLSGETANVADLEEGLTALKTDYFRKRYEIESAEKEKEITASLEKRYGVLNGVAEAQEKILGKTYTLYDTVTDISWKDRQRLNTLKAQVASIEDYLHNVEKIADIAQYSGKTKEELEKELKEPAITALLQYFGKSQELKSAEQEALANMLKEFESAFSDALSSGDFNKAKNLWTEAFFGNRDNYEKLMNEVGIKAGSEYMNGFLSQYYSAIAESDNPLAAYLAGSNWDIVFEQQNKKWYDILKSGTATWAEEWNARSMILENFGKRYDKFLSTYGSATTNVLSNTANLWNAVIEAKQKDIDKQKDEGKISEKEYNRRTEQNKKSFDNLKILQYASAIINTASSVVQALADPTVPSYYVKAINAAAALAAGTAQVIKIANTDFSGSAGAAGGETPRLVQSAPQVSYTVGVNEADYAAAQAQNPIRAYVVDKDLADGLDEYNARENETTF